MIILQRDKITYTQEGKSKEIESLIPFLSDAVQIKQPFTFENFMSLMFKEVDLYNYLFHHTLGGYPLENYIAETLSDEKDKNKTLYYLYSSKNIELYDEKEDITNELITYSIFGAIGAPDEYGGMSYSISMTHLSSIKHLPIFIDNECKIFKILDKSFDLIYNTDITVFEFINSILYEISFYGDYDRKQKLMQTLENRLDDFKK